MGAFKMKNDDWFRAAAYHSPEEESSMEGQRRLSVARTARALRPVLVSPVALVALLMLSWLVQVFICDFREALFPAMPRHATWLCG
jgi:hypothetical protein